MAWANAHDIAASIQLTAQREPALAIAKAANAPTSAAARTLAVPLPPAPCGGAFNRSELWVTSGIGGCVNSECALGRRTR